MKKTGQPNFTKGLKLARKRLKFAEKENRVATFTNSAEFTQSREYSRRYFFDLLKAIVCMYIHTYNCFCRGAHQKCIVDPRGGGGARLRIHILWYSMYVSLEKYVCSLGDRALNKGLKPIRPSS